jgi:hypothetical protein
MEKAAEVGAANAAVAVVKLESFMITEAKDYCDGFV